MKTADSLKKVTSKSTDRKAKASKNPRRRRKVLDRSHDGEIVHYDDGTLDVSGKTLVYLTAIAKQDRTDLVGALTNLFIRDGEKTARRVVRRRHVHFKGKALQLSDEVLRCVGGLESKHDVENAEMMMDSAILGMLLHKSRPVDSQAALVPVVKHCHLAKLAGLMARLEPGISFGEVVFALADASATEAIDDPELIACKISTIQTITALRRLEAKHGVAQVLAARAARKGGAK